MRTIAVLILLLVAACDDDPAPAAPDAGGSCRSLFGGAPVYLDCGGDAEACAFHTRGAIRTCGAVCAELGAECRSSYASEGGCARVSGDLGCQHPAAEVICECLRP